LVWDQVTFKTMGFVVLPALVPDISAVYDVYFAAFKENAVTRALFPSATEADMINPDSEFRLVIFLRLGRCIS
jgi:hypothetical protein